MTVLKTTYRICCLLALVLATGCNNFLEVKPKGTLIPEKMVDYARILASSEVTTYFPHALIYATDDYYERFDAVSVNVPANAFYWRADLDPTDLVEPAIWGPCYRAIYHYNVVINQVMDSQDGTLLQKQQLVAEARVGRAMAYFTMLTAFAKAYNPETAATDLGVPIVTSIAVTDAVPPRANLKDNFDLIINDITESINALPITNENAFRVTKRVAYALLTRIYLYQGNYAEAETYGKLTLDQPHALLQLSPFLNFVMVTRSDISPETIWMLSTPGTIPRLMVLANDISSHFGGPTDHRFRLFTSPTSQGSNRQFSPPLGPFNLGIAYPEIYLTVAEALARRDDVEGALALVNQLRQNRIHENSYVPLTTADPEEALEWILRERRAELALRGVRWMDMKRLDREGRMPDVQRIDASDGTVLATLPAGSNAYTFQIPVRVQLFNPTMPLNDR